MIGKMGSMLIIAVALLRGDYHFYVVILTLRRKSISDSFKRLPGRQRDGTIAWLFLRRDVQNKKS
jgi:hypothetical protein